MEGVPRLFHNQQLDKGQWSFENLGNGLNGTRTVGTPRGLQLILPHGEQEMATRRKMAMNDPYNSSHSKIVEHLTAKKPGAGYKTIRQVCPELGPGVLTRNESCPNRDRKSSVSMLQADSLLLPFPIVQFKGAAGFPRCTGYLFLGHFGNSRLQWDSIFIDLISLRSGY